MDFVDNNHSFITNVVQKIPGWLNEFTAAFAMDLLDKQAEDDIQGGAIEIGVFGGRFCSILGRDAVRRQSQVIAIDPFTRFPLQKVRDTLARATGMEQVGETSLCSETARLDLVQDYSSNWTAPMLRERLGTSARFIHVDGSHLREDVLWDLSMADQVLAPAGIIAVDDWLNSQCLGVMEATIQFYAQPPRASVPFAFVAGKLLLCGRRYAADYTERLMTFLQANEGYSVSKLFNERLANKTPWLHQTFCGFPLLVVPAG